MFARARQAKKVTIIAEMREALGLAIFDLQLQKNGRATIDDVTQEWIDKAITDYECEVLNAPTIEGKKINMTKDDVTAIFIVDLGLNIKDVDETAVFHYEIVERLDDKIKILIHVKDEVNGLSSIELPDMEPIIIEEDKKEEKTIEYEIEYDKEYKIKIKSEDGSQKEGIIIEHKLPKPTINIDTEWTNKALTLEVDFGTMNEQVKKEISIDGGLTYNIYTGPVQIEKNTVVKARTTGFGLQGEVELEIKNIDKLLPKEFTPTISDETSATELTISANAEDAEATNEYGQSGIKNYKYYVYQGDTLVVSSELTTDSNWKATGLTVGNIYNIYVEAYDNAGNMKKSEEIENYTKLEIYAWEKYSAKVTSTKYKAKLDDKTTTLSASYDYYQVDQYYAYTYEFSTSTGQFVNYRHDIAWDVFSALHQNKGYYFYHLGNYYLYVSCTFPESHTGKQNYTYTGYKYLGSEVVSTYSKNELLGTVTSTDPNAYPASGVQDGYWYEKK